MPNWDPFVHPGDHGHSDGQIPHQHLCWMPDRSNGETLRKMFEILTSSHVVQWTTISLVHVGYIMLYPHEIPIVIGWITISPVKSYHCFVQPIGETADEIPTLHRKGCDGSNLKAQIIAALGHVGWAVAVKPHGYRKAYPLVLPSGYVKIAIENDHRNSGFSY